MFPTKRYDSFFSTFCGDLKPTSECILHSTLDWVVPFDRKDVASLLPRNLLDLRTKLWKVWDLGKELRCLVASCFWMERGISSFEQKLLSKVLMGGRTFSHCQWNIMMNDGLVALCRTRFGSLVIWAKLSFGGCARVVELLATLDIYAPCWTWKYCSPRFFGSFWA